MSDPAESRNELVAGSPTAQPPWPRGLPLALVVAATFVAYAGALTLQFVVDDRVLVLDDAWIRSWRFLPKYFSTHIWGYTYPHLLANYYRPVFMIWLRVDHALFGLTPAGWHLNSVLVHVGVTCLVFCLARRLQLAALPAAVAALIFGLHPAHVETVAYISAIPDPLSAFFLLAAFLSWLRWRGTERHPAHAAWLVVSLLAFLLALLAKESGMALPVFVALYAGIYGSHKGEKVTVPDRLKAALQAAAPFLAVVLAYVPLRVHALRGFAHAVTPVTPREEFFTLPSVLFSYLRLLIWPHPLSLYYDLTYLSAPTAREFFLPLAGLFLAFALLAAWYRWTLRVDLQEGNCLAFAFLWAVVAILPVLDLRVLPKSEIVHDRYLYLPSVGVTILAGLAFSQVLRAVQFSKWKRAAVAAATATACLAMGLAAARQTLYWYDDFSLSYHAHEVAPRSVAATTNLAAAIAQRGMEGPAVELYKQALALQPDFWRANVNLGYLYYQHGDFREAANYFQHACAADPTDGDQFLYLGVSLARLKRLGEAEQAIRKALLVRPNGVNYHASLAIVLDMQGKSAEAICELQKQLAVTPENRPVQDMLQNLQQQAK